MGAVAAMGAGVGAESNEVGAASWYDPTTVEEVVALLAAYKGTGVRLAVGNTSIGVTKYYPQVAEDDPGGSTRTRTLPARSSAGLVLAGAQAVAGLRGPGTRSMRAARACTHPTRTRTHTHVHATVNAMHARATPHSSTGTSSPPLARRSHSQPPSHSGVYQLGHGALAGRRRHRPGPEQHHPRRRCHPHRRHRRLREPGAPGPLWPPAGDGAAPAEGGPPPGARSGAPRQQLTLHLRSRHHTTVATQVLPCLGAILQDATQCPRVRGTAAACVVNFANDASCEAE